MIWHTTETQRKALKKAAAVSIGTMSLIIDDDGVRFARPVSENEAFCCGVAYAAFITGTADDWTIGGKEVSS